MAVAGQTKDREKLVEDFQDTNSVHRLGRAIRYRLDSAHRDLPFHSFRFYCRTYIILSIAFRCSSIVPLPSITLLYYLQLQRFRKTLSLSFPPVRLIGMYIIK